MLTHAGQTRVRKLGELVIVKLNCIQKERIHIVVALNAHGFLPGIEISDGIDECSCVDVGVGCDLSSVKGQFAC